ncbi:hypothetical protein CERZMDRAFT_89212 [Cercospora zeae-maydis SCOH1-5]|uniref:Peptidase S8/S53 domain-containing protein n=1 Tax=Cercospora zeae-maydis SCOH1-5 TaxID=717836 RepID=A0A6A6EWG9_9PEZI|nr:hypothetical protein CERZMDRAFT_89212 [Cercospora zeae-maydis SCOH1-5]
MVPRWSHLGKVLCAAWRDLQHSVKQSGSESKRWLVVVHQDATRWSCGRRSRAAIFHCPLRVAECIEYIRQRRAADARLGDRSGPERGSGRSGQLRRRGLGCLHPGTPGTIQANSCRRRLGFTFLLQVWWPISRVPAGTHAAWKITGKMMLCINVADSFPRKAGQWFRARSTSSFGRLPLLRRGRGERSVSGTGHPSERNEPSADVPMSPRGWWYLLSAFWLSELCTAIVHHRNAIIELDGAARLVGGEVDCLPDIVVDDLSQKTEEILTDFASLAAREDGSSIVSKRRDLHSDLFQGFSIAITSSRGAEQVDAIYQAIRGHHAVQNAWISSSTVASLSGSGLEAWGQRIPGDPLLREVIRKQSNAHPPHVQVGVDKLHAAGIKGEGIRIAILDTGFDYKQEPFGHRIGPGQKIVYGHDWVGDFGMNISDSDDPYTECSHHGTHVLGIVAADPTDFGVVGAAPEATIELHRVFDCDDRNDEDTLFSALTAAWERGVDVINCSWGLSDSYESAITTLAARIMKNGTYVQFTAGNDGPKPFTIDTPGAAHDISAVGSVDCASSAAYFWNGSFYSNGMHHDIRWVPGLTNYTVTEFPPDLEVWAPLENVTENLPWQPSAFPATFSMPDMDKTVLLIRLDFFAIFHDQIVNLIKPKYMLTYHPMGGDLGFPGMYFPSWPLSELPDTSALATVEHETAVEIVQEIAHGNRVAITLAQQDAHTHQATYALNTRTGGRMTENSGWGPTAFGEAGVTFAAPGGRILSTLPRLYGGFGQLTGTSMAAPLVTGVVALLRQLHPDWTPDLIRNVLATTARPMPYTDNSTHDYGFLAPVIQQGGGLIDAWSAARATTLVNVSSLEFLDLNRKPASLSFSLTNAGNETISFRISHTGAASGYAKTTPEDTFFADDKYLAQSRMLMAVYAHVQVHPESLTLSPGETADVRVAVTPPAELDASRLPFYGGYITLNSTDGAQNLTIPFSGIAARLPEDLPLVDTKSVTPAIYRPADGQFLGCSTETIFELVRINDTTHFSSGAWPAITYDKPLLPIREAKVSVIDADSKQAVFTHELSHKDWRAKRWYWDGSGLEQTDVRRGRYVWRLQYLGLLARDGEYTTIDTESFRIGDERHTQQYHATFPELEDLPCDISAAKGDSSQMKGEPSPLNTDSRRAPSTRLCIPCCASGTFHMQADLLDVPLVAFYEARDVAYNWYTPSWGRRSARGRNFGHVGGPHITLSRDVLAAISAKTVQLILHFAYSSALRHFDTAVAAHGIELRPLDIGCEADHGNAGNDTSPGSRFPVCK